MSNPVLQLDNVYRRYHQAERVIEVLSGASLSLYPGQLTALVGPSGAGKTTLLNMAGMLERPDEGEVYIQQVATSGLPERRRTRLRGLHIGFVFQFHRLFPEFSALENIVIAQMINQLPRHEAEERAKELLAMVGLQDRAMHRPAQLSGGRAAARGHCKSGRKCPGNFASRRANRKPRPGNSCDCLSGLAKAGTWHTNSRADCYP